MGMCACTGDCRKPGGRCSAYTYGYPSDLYYHSIPHSIPMDLSPILSEIRTMQKTIDELSSQMSLNQKDKNGHKNSK